MQEQTKPVMRSYLAATPNFASGSETPRQFLEQSLAERRFYPHPGYSIALDYAALGDKNRVFDALESAFRDRDLDVLSLLCSPEFDWLHDDPRYRNLVRRVGLPF